MPRDYSTADSVAQIAAGLIPNNHPDLATARLLYVFVDKAGMKGGVEQLGKSKKLTGLSEWAMEKDFVLEVPLDRWNDLDPNQRTALVDHLLECCTGEEDEKTGDMKWQIRSPEVNEFASILQRHGAWHSGLASFVEVAQGIELDEVVEQEADIDIDALMEQSTEATE